MNPLYVCFAKLRWTHPYGPKRRYAPAAARPAAPTSEESLTGKANSAASVSNRRVNSWSEAMKTIGVAIHGAGWVSSEHIRAYQRNPHTEVVAIGSRTRESAERRAA